MTWYLQSTDLYVWDVIEDGPALPTKLVDPRKNGMSLIEEIFN